MRSNLASIKLHGAPGKRQEFGVSLDCDFFLLHNKKLYGLRKQYIKASDYLRKNIQKNHKVHVVFQNLDTSALERILSCFYGFDCCFHRDFEIMAITRAVMFLGLSELYKAIRKDIQQNFNNYELFTLLNFAFVFSEPALQQKCYRELSRRNFIQIYTNRSSLLRAHRDVVTSIAKQHQRLRTEGKIKGLKSQKLRKLLEQYNSANTAKINLVYALTPSVSNVILEDPEQEFEYKDLDTGLKSGRFGRARLQNKWTLDATTESCYRTQQSKSLFEQQQDLWTQPSSQICIPQIQRAYSSTEYMEAQMQGPGCEKQQDQSTSPRSDSLTDSKQIDNTYCSTLEMCHKHLLMTINENPCHQKACRRKSSTSEPGSDQQAQAMEVLSKILGRSYDVGCRARQERRSPEYEFA